MIDEARQLRRLYWGSFALRFSLGIAGWLLMLFLEIPLLQDAQCYEEIGAGIAHDWLDGRSSEWLAHEGREPHQPVLMVTVIACFYVLTFGVRALPLLMAFYSAITAFTPLLTYRICRQIGGSQSAALISGWLVGVCPALVFWCGALYKEGLVLLVLNLAVHHALRLQAAWRPRSFLTLSVCLLSMVALRLYAALIMAVAIGLGLLLQRNKRFGQSAALRIPVRQPLVAMLFAVIAVALGLAVHVQQVIPKGVEDCLRLVQNSRDDLANAPSGYLPEADITTPQGAARFLPAGLTYFLTVPLPWQTGSLRQNLAIPDTTVWLLLYPLILIGMFRGLRNNFQASLLPIFVTLGFCLFYGLLVGNIGTAYRLRVQVWLLWAPFVGLGWAQLARRAVTRKPVACLEQQTA
jgi:hypothetical protein